MRISECVYKITWLVPRHMGQHLQKKRVARDVGWHTQKHVSRSLVKLQVQLPTQNADLPYCMTGWERHYVNFSRVPSRNDQTAAVWCFTDGIDQPNNLVDAAAMVKCAPIRFGTGLKNCGEIAPLPTVNRAKIAVFIGPFIPNGNTVFFQLADIGVTGKEPEQFVDNGFQMKFLGGDQRKSVGHRVTRLQTETGQCSRACPVTGCDTLFQYGAEQLVVLLQVAFPASQVLQDYDIIPRTTSIKRAWPAQGIAC